MAGVGFAQVLFMAVAGGLGAVARWGADTWLKKHIAPLWSLTCINVLGSFLLGLCVVGFADAGGAGAGLELIIGTGFLGGFTTFSTVMVETVGSGVVGFESGGTGSEVTGAAGTEGTGGGGGTGRVATGRGAATGGGGAGAAGATGNTGTATGGARRWSAHRWGTLAWGSIGMLLVCVLAFLAGLTLGGA